MAVLSKMSFYHSIFVMLGISAVKLSIGFFLLRVAQKSKYRKFIIGMIGNSRLSAAWAYVSKVY